MAISDWIAKFSRSAAPAQGAVNRWMREGFGHQRSGDFGKARQCYRRILEAQPENADALFLLGDMALAESRHAEAVEWLERAVRVNGAIAEFHHRLGAAREAAGNAAGAILSYEEAARLAPGDADVRNNLGCLLEKQGLRERAEAAYRQAIDCNPDLAQAHFNLGNVLASRDQLAEALECYRNALALEPGSARVHCGLGWALRKAGEGERKAAIAHFERALELAPETVEAARELGIAWLEEGDAAQAEAYTHRALQLEPRSVELHLHLGNIFRHARRFDDALASFRDAVALQPGSAQAHNNLGSGYLDLERLDEAMGAFRKAIELDPGLAEAHLNLGIALQKSGDEAAAIARYLDALRADPKLAEAWLNLGCAREREGDPEAALECYDRALAAKPDDAQAHFNRALQLLLTGKFAEGWQEYEWRWRLPDMGLGGVRAFSDRTHWEGEPLAGRTILLFAEQGFGDSIQFVRYASAVAERGGKVIVHCHTRLKALFGTVTGVAAVSCFGEPLPDFDLCCSLLSLPRILGTTLDAIPAQVPYLRAPEARSRYWRERIAADPAPFRVGLFWSTDAQNTLSIAKSLSLQMLAPLARVRGVGYYSLQRGAAAKQVANAPREMKLIDASPDLADFADDVALIANLDLVVSIDTATAHLAGALGARVWTFTHYPPEWRWLREREDSPWYPSMRLFRQGPGESWTPAIERAAQALDRLAGDHALGRGSSSR